MNIELGMRYEELGMPPPSSSFQVSGGIPLFPTLQLVSVLREVGREFLIPNFYFLIFSCSYFQIGWVGGWRSVS